MAIRYRPFRNFDPPALVQIWNESLTGRGAAFLPSVEPLDCLLLSKLYFERDGLIVAEDDGRPVGFAHAGFGPDHTGRRLSTETGIVCVVLVRASHRAQGIGSQLLHRAEEYLRTRGAKTIYFGAMRPLNPFYFGLYGGSELPGVLKSEASAARFLESNGYAVWDRCLVFERRLESPLNVPDVRFVTIRRNYEMETQPRPPGSSWFEECVLAPLEVTEFTLRHKGSGQLAARALTWEMDAFGWRRHEPAAGIMNVTVEEPHRRQGLGKYLLVQIIRHYQAEYFNQIEVQAMDRNTAAIGLYQALGFAQVDEGRVYRLERNP